MLVHGGAVHPLHLKCNADLRRVFAAGQIPIVVALAHAHPAAVRVKGGAGHEHKVQRFRFQQLRPLRHRRADAVKPRLPAVRAGHGGRERISLAAHRVGEHFAPPKRFFGKGGKVGFGPEGRIQ